MDLCDYELDPINGVLYKNGRKCGGLNAAGYMEMRTGKSQRQRVHRMIWMWCHGEIPENKVIDHIDGCRTNNVPWNLQCIPQYENVMKGKVAKAKHHHIYVKPSGSFSVQVKGIGPQRSFPTIELAIEYRDQLLSKRAEEELRQAH